MQSGQTVTHTFVRGPVVVTSVDYSMGMDMLAYMRIYSFKESTLQEVQDALAKASTYGAKGLILDLRGNPGGLFKSAIKVSELFLGSGVIVHSRSRDGAYNGDLPKHAALKADIMNPLTLPVAILVDGETASSAEVLAGALRDRPLTRLFGQTTYGKGSIQSTIPLGKSQGGVRITVAHLFSPTTRQPYTGRGIVPHVFVDVNSPALLSEARTYLLGLGRMMQ